VETTDVLASIYLHLASDVREQLAKDEAAITGFNSRVDALSAGSVASSGVGASAGVADAAEASALRQSAAIETSTTAQEAAYRRMEAAGLKAYESDQVAAGRAAIAAQAASDKETAAALKSSEAQIAASQRITLQVAREYEKQGAAAEAAAVKQDAALAKVGKGAGLFTLGIAGIAYETSKMASNFQRDMEMIHTQAGAPQSEVTNLTGKVLTLSGVVGFGPDSLANSLYHAESAGYREAAALGITATAAKDAQIGHADLETTTQALVGVMSSHIKGVKDAADAGAYLNSIVGIGDMRMQGLAQSIGTGVLPSFRNFGLGIRDFGAALATLTDNLVPPDEAATRLRMTVALLGAPSGAAAKALEAVGISASDANAALSHRDELAQYGIHLTDLSTDMRKPDGLLVALEDLKKHLEGAGLSAAEQGAVLTRAFGGGRSSAAILTLYNELDRLKSKYVDLGTGVQKFADDWNKTTQTTAFEAAQSKANIDALGISFGQALVPAATEFLNVITPAGKALAGLVADHKTLTADLLVGAGLTASFVAVVGGVTKIIGSVKTLGLAWDAVRAKAIAAGIAELGPLAVIPIAIGAGAAAGYGIRRQEQSSEKTISSGMQQQEQQYLDSLALGYAKGTVSLKEYNKEADASMAMIPGLQKLSYVQLEVLKGDSIGSTKADMFLALSLAQDKATKGSSAGAPALVDLTKQIADAQKHVNDAVNQAATDQEAYGHVLTAHQKTLDAWKIRLQTLQDLQSKLTSAVGLSTAALKAADDEVKRLNADQQAHAKEGLAQEQAAFTSMADAAISEAKRMRTGVVSEYDSMLAHITKNIPLGTIIPPTPLQTTYLGPNQFPTNGPAGSPSASASALDPQIAGANSLLAATIKSFPLEFQAAFDSELSKYKTSESDLYATYIGKLNKENAADASAINAINATYQKQLVANLAEAQVKDKAEHDRYLGVLQTLEGNYNSKLSGNLQTFNTNFQTTLTTFQAAEAVAQNKAASDATQHEDRLRSLEADTIAKLAAVHGKNSAQQRQAIDESYAKSVSLEDANYNRTVGLNEAYFKNLGLTFDKQISGLKALFDRQNAAAATQLAKDEKSAKGKDATALSGIQSWLDGRDSKAASAREAALAKEAGIYVKVVNGIVEAFDKGGKLIAQHMLTDTSATGQLGRLTSKAQDGYDKALAAAELDTIKFGSVSEKHALALSRAIDLQDKLTAAQAKALAAAVDNSTVPNFPGARFGQIGQPAPGAPSIGSLGGGFGATLPGVIAGGIALQDVFGKLVAAGTASIATTDQQNLANLQVAINAKDTGTQFSILDALYLKGGKGLDGLVVTLPQVVKAYNDNQVTVNASTQRTLAYDVATGDLTGALAIAKQGYLDGTGSLQAYVAIQKALNLQTDQTTTKTIAFDVAMGDATGAATLATQQYMAGTRSLADTVPLVQAGNVATAAATQKTWDLAYSAGDAAVKSSMLAQAFSGIISQASTIAGAQSSVDNANLAVIAAKSSVLVGLMQAQVTETTDLASIITASSGVQTAIFNGQLAGINDQVPILNDLYALTQATSPQQLKVDQDQLAIDRATATMDQQNAAAAARVASDAARTAIDKLSVDRANAAAAAVVGMDQLKVAQDTALLTADQQTLTLDSLVVLNSINSTLGGVTDYGNLIAADLASIQQDQGLIRTDQLQLAQDQSTANQIAAQGAQQQANDALQQAADQASANSISQSGQLQIAELKKQLAADNILLQKNTAATAASAQQLVDQGAEIRDSLDAIFGQGERMMQGLVSENISNLDPRQIAGATYAGQKASNRTSSS
jgi:hypothetical protein